MNSFVYLISNQNREIAGLKHFDLGSGIKNPIQLGRAVQPLLVEDELLKNGFTNVKVGILTQNFTIVPNSLFDPSETNRFYSQITELSENDKVKTDDLEFLNARLVYAIDKGIQFLIKLHFPECTIYHQVAAWLAGIRQFTIQERIHGNYLFANVHGQMVQLALFKDDRLVIVNNYNYRSKEDFLYFIFLLCDQFSVQPDAMPLYFSGHITQENELFRSVYQYVQSIHLVTWPVNLLNSSSIQSPTQSTYFDLAGLTYFL